MKKGIMLQSLLACCGLLFGMIAYLVLADEQVAALQQYLFVQMQNLTSTANLPEVASRILRANVMDIVRIYLAGACLLGLPILLLLLFLKGFTLGFVSCFLLQHSPLLVVTRLLYLPVFILSAVIACRFSMMLLQNQLSNPVRQLLEYTISFGLLLILVVLCSYVDGLSCSHYLQHSF